MAQTEDAADENGETGSAPQPSEGEPDEAGQEGGQAVGSAMPIEGMTQENAAALLDTLRGGEKLLPFVEPGTPRNRGKLRDW